MAFLRQAFIRESQRPGAGGGDPLHCFYTANPQPSEARRWLRQAKADFMAIENDQDGPVSSPAWACFKSQQVAEKALKSVVYHRNATDRVLREHDVGIIATKLDNTKLETLAHELLTELHRDAYTRTRYPDKTKGGIPANMYSDDQARASKNVCFHILRIVGTIIGLPNELGVEDRN